MDEIGREILNNPDLGIMQECEGCGATGVVPSGGPGMVSMCPECEGACWVPHVCDERCQEDDGLDALRDAIDGA